MDHFNKTFQLGDSKSHFFSQPPMNRLAVDSGVVVHGTRPEHNMSKTNGGIVTYIPMGLDNVKKMPVELTK